MWLTLLYLFLWARFWPELEQPLYDLLGESGIFLQELHYTVGQLGMVERKAPNLMQWNEDLAQELFVLGLQRQCEPVDNATKNLEEFTDSIKVFCFVYEPKEIGIFP